MRPLRRKSPTDPFQMTGTILKGTINAKLLANNLFTFRRPALIVLRLLEIFSQNPIRRRTAAAGPTQPGPDPARPQPTSVLSYALPVRLKRRIPVLLAVLLVAAALVAVVQLRRRAPPEAA